MAFKSWQIDLEEKVLQEKYQNLQENKWLNDWTRNKGERICIINIVIETVKRGTGGPRYLQGFCSLEIAVPTWDPKLYKRIKSYLIAKNNNYQKLRDSR